MSKKIIALLILCWNIFSQSYQISFDQQFDHDKKKLNVNIKLAQNEMILKQTMNISIDNPHVQIIQQLYSPSEKKYIPEFAESKEIFKNNVKISTELNTELKQNI